MNRQHIGSDFDDFLAEEGLLADFEVAMKRVIAFQIEKVMEEQNLSYDREGSAHEHQSLGIEQTS